MNKESYIVGITGGIGAGKSTVCRIFEYLKVPVYYADYESKQLINNDDAIVSEIKQHFGENLYSEGKIDNKALGNIVFKDPSKLEVLNGIIHPRIKAHFLDWAKAQSSPYIIKEAAILFESATNADCKKVISVYAPLNVRIKRAMDRDSLSKQQVLDRISKQMNEEEKRDKADFVIFNSGEEMLIPQVLKLHKIILAKA